MTANKGFQATPERHAVLRGEFGGGALEPER